VDSIEHGHGVDCEDLELMKTKGTFLVPTVGVIDALVEQHSNDPITPEHRKRREAFLQGIQQGIQQAMSLGVRVASALQQESRSGLNSEHRRRDQLRLDREAASGLRLGHLSEEIFGVHV
jgi:hypothetical protein